MGKNMEGKRRDLEIIRRSRRTPLRLKSVRPNVGGENNIYREKNNGEKKKSPSRGISRSSSGCSSSTSSSSASSKSSRSSMSRSSSGERSCSGDAFSSSCCSMEGRCRRLGIGPLGSGVRRRGEENEKKMPKNDKKMPKNVSKMYKNSRAESPGYRHRYLPGRSKSLNKKRTNREKNPEDTPEDPQNPLKDAHDISYYQRKYQPNRSRRHLYGWDYSPPIQPRKFAMNDHTNSEKYQKVAQNENQYFDTSSFTSGQSSRGRCAARTSKHSENSNQKSQKNADKYLKNHKKIPKNYNYHINSRNSRSPSNSSYEQSRRGGTKKDHKRREKYAEKYDKKYAEKYDKKYAEKYDEKYAEKYDKKNAEKYDRKNAKKYENEYDEKYAEKYGEKNAQKYEKKYHNKYSGEDSSMEDEDGRGESGGKKLKRKSRWKHDGYLNRSPSPEGRNKPKGPMWDTRKGQWKSRAGGVFLPPSPSSSSPCYDYRKNGRASPCYD